jgi:uncharacterized protein (DUF885 family)
MSPTIIQYNKVRFFFFSNDHEPKHIHVSHAEKNAKIELETLKVIYNYGFNSKDLKRIVKEVEKRQSYLIESWNNYFKNGV